MAKIFYHPILLKFLQHIRKPCKRLKRTSTKVGKLSSADWLISSIFRDNLLDLCYWIMCSFNCCSDLYLIGSTLYMLYCAYDAKYFCLQPWLLYNMGTVIYCHSYNFKFSCINNFYGAALIQLVTSKGIVVLFRTSSRKHL